MLSLSEFISNKFFIVKNSQKPDIFHRSLPSIAMHCVISVENTSQSVIRPLDIAVLAFLVRRTLKQIS
jgi:hypothetical protein